MSFAEFQDGCNGGHLGYRNRINLAILNLYVAAMPPIMFWVNPTYGLGDVVWSISRSHLRNRNRTILAILNLYNSPKPPIKFQHYLTYCLGLDVIWRISRWPPWRPFWMLKRNDFSVSESLCHCDASHQVLAQSNLQFGRRCRLKNFKMAAIKFQLYLTYCLGLDVIWRISRWPPWRPFWMLKRNDFSVSGSLCHCDASHQVLAQSNLQFGRRCRLKNFKIAAMAAILDIGTEQF